MATDSVTAKKVPSGRLAAVLSHPLRCRITGLLSGRTASPIEMARELDESIGDVSYHTRVLKRAGAIELVRSRQVRGSIEHYYAAVQRPEVSDEEYAALSDEARRDFVLSALQFAIADAGDALDAGTMTGRPDHCISWMPGSVDEEGWSRLNEIYTRAFGEVQEVFGESANRLAEDDDAKSIPVSSLLSFFERPRRAAKAQENVAVEK